MWFLSPQFWIYLVIVIIVVIVGYFITDPAVKNGGWYSTLERPPGVPPSWIFGVVWAILYIFIFIGGSYADYQSTNDPNTLTLARWIFGIQLVLNLLWTITFFGLRNVKLALIINVLLIIAILACVIVYYTMVPNGWINGTLFVIYLLWSCYALYLTIGYGIKNGWNIA